MPTIGDQIRDCAIELLKDKPEGVRYGQLVAQIRQKNAAFKTNTISGSIWGLEVQRPDQVYKPSRGLYRLVEFRDTTTNQLKPELVAMTVKIIAEEHFYKPFTDWLTNEMEECTKAIALGGNKFKDKWGTPDVVGKRESRRSDIIQGQCEIVAAEIKLDMSQLVTAFGQACAYCLFAHKSYLVIPVNAPQDEIDRIDSLCQVFGIGLVLFDSNDPEDPDFQIRVRPQKHDPDMFYVNKYMKQIEGELFS
jgi:hypothetical protein